MHVVIRPSGPEQLKKGPESNPPTAAWPFFFNVSGRIIGQHTQQTISSNEW